MMSTEPNPYLELLRTRIWFQHSLVILACICCYGGSLHGDFVYDDAVAIVRNPDVSDRNRTTLTDLWRHDFWGQNLSDAQSHKSYRPLTTLTFRWENAVFGQQAAPMKLHNFLLHSAVSCLLLRLVPLLLPTVDVAAVFAAVVAFAVHPVHCEAVAGIVGRAELLCAVWYVLGLLVWQRRRRTLGWGWLTDSMGVLTLAVLALLSKEQGVMLLPMCLVLDVVEDLFAERKRRGWLDGVVVIVPCLLRWRSVRLIVMTGGLVYVRLWVMGFQRPEFKVMDNPVAAAEVLQTKIFSQNYLYALNFWLLLCPDWLSFDWALGSIELVEHWTDMRCLAIVAFNIVLISLLLPGQRKTVLSLAMLVVPFLPASGIVPVGFVIAERILYIPSIGFCMLFAIGVDKLCRLRTSPHSFRSFVAYATVTLIVVHAMRCRWRANEWANETALYLSALRVCPNNAKVHYNIAKMLADRSVDERAIAMRFYEEAIRLYPDYEAAYTNLGNLYRDDHKLDLAEQHIRKAIEIREEFPPAWMNLGIVLAAQGKYDQALASYRKALRYRPKYSTCQYNIGNLYIQLNNATEALKYWSEAVRLDPRNTKAWANILSAHDNAGRVDDVLRLSETAMRLVPDEVTVMFIRANALGKLERYAEAEDLYARVVQMRPDYALYYVNLGVLYHRWKRYSYAVGAYRRALELDPTLETVQANLEKVLRLVEKKEQRTANEKGGNPKKRIKM